MRLSAINHRASAFRGSPSDQPCQKPHLESDVEVYDGAKYQLRVELTGGGSVVSFTVPEGLAANGAPIQ